MKTRSAKAKGKRLEKWVVAKLLSTFPDLTTDDVRCTVGSETGADIKLSAKAKTKFEFEVEVKNQERCKFIYDFYEQATKHGPYEPLVVICKNHEKPLVILDAEYFIQLVKDANA